MTRNEAIDKAERKLDESSVHTMFRDLCDDNDTDIANAAINLIADIETAKRTGKIPKFLVQSEGAHLWDRHVLGFLWVVMAWCEFERGPWVRARAERLMELAEDGGFEE